ncbi:MAG TPA: hypothetical protein P5243_08425 [Bacteroidales bacterium]|nr:hypothetical protein [Bacteroidales bacterium]HRS19515.1 hypothetical protein [Bacteroidales bacterium]
MKHLKKHIITIIILYISNIFAYSQTTISHTSYECIGDNREYFSPYGFPQTILGSRISQDFIIQTDSLHSITLGGKYLLIHGANQFANTPVITAMYTYSNNYVTFKTGSFPMQRNMFPLAMYTDSLYYFRPNMQGALVSYSNKMGFWNIEETGIFDWLLQENYGANESFLAGISGTLWYKNVFNKHYYYYRHHATDTPTGNKAVEDNGSVLLTLGYATHTPITLSYEIGKLITWQELRGSMEKYSGGLFTQATISYNRLKADATYYFGDPTYLPLGDPLYRSGNYARINTSLEFLKSKHVQGIFSFCTHIIAHEINFSQQLSILVNIDTNIGK